MIKECYNSIQDESVAEFKDRGSKFIAYAFPVNATGVFKKRLQELKAAHPKAVHHCFAYRIGTDGNTFRSSDDGEPSGTAGKPILGQIDSKELTDIAIIVVRYWGGTLLGVPGLINAYKTSATLALQTTPVIQKQVEISYVIHFDYSNVNDIMTILKQYNCNIISREMQLFCTIHAGIPVSRLNDALYKLGELKNVEIKKQ